MGFPTHIALLICQIFVRQDTVGTAALVGSPGPANDDMPSSEFHASIG